MKKRTALFAGTALLSLAAATALYAPCTGVTKDNYITAGGAYNLNNSTAGKLSAVFAGTDSFGAGGVPASEVDRIQFGAESARAAIADVGQVIDGTAPAIVGTEESNLASKAEAVRGLIDGIENVPGEHNIDAKLKNLARALDGTNNLADGAGRRLLDKVNRIADLIDTPSGNLEGQVEWARRALDGRQAGAATTLNAAIANVIGGEAGTPATGFIGSDAVANNGSGAIDGAASAVQKLQVITSLISTGADPVAVSVADALIDVQGNGTGGIIGNPLRLDDEADGYVNPGILAQLTSARNLIDATDGQDTIENALHAVQGDPDAEGGATFGVIGTDAAGDGTIDAATSILTKLEAFMTKLSQKLATGAGVNAGVTYNAPGELNLSGIEAGLQIV